MCIVLVKNQDKKIEKRGKDGTRCPTDTGKAMTNIKVATQSLEYNVHPQKITETQEQRRHLTGTAQHPVPQGRMAHRIAHMHARIPLQ